MKLTEPTSAEERLTMLEGRALAMQQILALVLARVASQYDNPEAVIAALLAPLDEFLEAFEHDDPEQALLSEAFSKTADAIEGLALRLVQP